MLPDEKAATKSFSGMIIVENWKGEITESYKIENGREYKMLTTVTAKTKREGSTEQICKDTDWFICGYYGGVLQGCSYSRTTTQCFGGGGSSGGGWPEPEPRDPGTVDTGTPVEVSDITDSLKTPCFKSVLQLTSNGALVNTVSKILLKTFGVGDEININFREEAISDLATDGKTTGSQASQYIYITTTLNTSALKNASKEYIAATILHEVLHGYFRVKNLNPTVDHNEMGKSYVSEMANGIKEMFPSLSIDEATSLAWGGLQESDAWSEWVKNYPTESNNIVQVNKNHKYNGAGTKCP